MRFITSTCRCTRSGLALGQTSAAHAHGMAAMLQAPHAACRCCQTLLAKQRSTWSLPLQSLTLSLQPLPYLACALIPEDDISAACSVWGTCKGGRVHEQVSSKAEVRASSLGTPHAIQSSLLRQTGARCFVPGPSTCPDIKMGCCWQAQGIAFTLDERVQRPRVLRVLQKRLVLLILPCFVMGDRKQVVCLPSCHGVRSIIACDRGRQVRY